MNNTKTFLITGATDGIGLETAHALHALGHRVLVHGRNPEKVTSLANQLATKGFVADLSDFQQTAGLAEEVLDSIDGLDVLINNAGVFQTSTPLTTSGLDVRFMVNTIAPYLLTKQLLPLFGAEGRVINLSSAAQAPLSFPAFLGETQIRDPFQAYAQSKLGITSWTRELAIQFPEGPMMVAVNPGSLLGTKMVREGFGTEGNDIRIGSDILVRAALSDEFTHASGQYFDNDRGQFSDPHPDALRPETGTKLVEAMESLLQVHS